MTDQATTEAVPAVTSEGAVVTGTNEGSSVPAANDFLAGLQDAESRQWVESKGYKDINNIVSDARYADKLKAEVGDLRSKSLTPPAQDAKPEEWDSFYAKLGRPEKAEAYDFKMPDGLPENLPYDGEFANQYKAWAHQAGLTPKQAQSQHDAFVKYQAVQTAKHQEAQAAAEKQQTEAAHAAITKAWGDKGSNSYQTELQWADRAFQHGGIKDALARMGITNAEGTIREPEFAVFLARAGKAMFAEPSFVTGSAAVDSRPLAQRMYPPDKDPFRRT